MTAPWTSLLHVDTFAHVRPNHPKWYRAVTFIQSKRAGGRKKSRRRSPARLISSLSHSFRKCLDDQIDQGLSSRTLSNYVAKTLQSAMSRLPRFETCSTQSKI